MSHILTARGSVVIGQLRDVAERVVTTFAMTYLGMFATMAMTRGSGSGITLTSQEALIVASIAAALSVVKNVLATVIHVQTGTRWWQDAIERVVITYVQVYIGLLTASGTFDIGLWKTAAIAAVPAAINLLKVLLLQQITTNGLGGLFAAPAPPLSIPIPPAPAG